MGHHDRHFCVKGGRPYYRTWAGGGYYGEFNGVNVWDGNFHTWELTCQTGVGQKAYIDDVLVATHSYDHSDFDWKDIVRIGYSQDCGGNFYGEIKDVEIIAFQEGGNGLLYGENNFHWPSHTGNLMFHRGADVYVRNYAALLAEQDASGVRLSWLMAACTLLLMLFVF